MANYDPTLANNASNPIYTSGSGGGGSGSFPGGLTPFHQITAATNNATVVKASAGIVGGWCFSNTNAATRYVKFYNKSTAPAPATDAEAFVIAVPGGTTAAPTVVTSNSTLGVNFTSGISFAVVANMSDVDNTSVTAGDMSVDLLYT